MDKRIPKTSSTISSGLIIMTFFFYFFTLSLTFWVFSIALLRSTACWIPPYVKCFTSLKLLGFYIFVITEEHGSDMMFSKNNIFACSSSACTIYCCWIEFPIISQLSSHFSDWNAFSLSQMLSRQLKLAHRLTARMSTVTYSLLRNKNPRCWIYPLHWKCWHCVSLYFCTIHIH